LFTLKFPWYAVRALIIATVALLIGAFALVSPASAHGSVVDPMSRNYGCWYRWGSDFQNPAMATEDPMCWQAWQYDVQAMWNWNGLYREGVAGQHQAVIPDGQLCSAGHTQNGRYNAMDAVGDWKATNISTNFKIKLYDQASHGADYIWVYATKQGYDPLTQPLKWSDLELVGQIGNTPAAQWTPESAGGVSIQVAGNAPGRTGRGMLYTIWQASHLDQSYYFCSDVNFGGSGSTPTPTASATPTRSATPSATPSSPRPTSASPTTSPTTGGGGTGACTATYKQVGSWSGGFQGEVTVTAGSAGITNGWTVKWTLASGQSISQAWNATVTTSGTAATAVNASWNKAVAAGTSTTFGFLGSGTASTPTLSCSAN